MNVVFYLNLADKPYLFRLKELTKSTNVWLAQTFSVLLEAKIKATNHDAKWVVTTRHDMLAALCKEEGYDSRKEINLWDYVGSIFHYKGINFLILPPLDSLVKDPAGEFIFKRAYSKIAEPKAWFPQTAFNFQPATPASLPALYESFKSCFAIAIDIETIPEHKLMKEVGYTGIFWGEASKSFTTTSFTLEVTTPFMLAWVRQFNLLPAPKIGQNFKYDLAYLLRYDALPVNYLWDTLTLFHCYYAELPKDLGFQSAFFIRDFKFWKHMSSASDAETKLLYNGYDTWATANVFLAAMWEMPDWSKENYLMEFPVIAPAFFCESVGIKADVEQLRLVKARKEVTLERELARIKLMTSSGFNPNSSPQVKKLLKILGHDVDTSDAKMLEKISYLDPLAGVILEAILAYKEASKAVSTYLKEDKLFNGRTLYAINPHGAETGRNASKSHHLGSKGAPVGLNIQNITRSDDDVEEEANENIKSYMVADEGFVFGEADYAQAESRDTGFLSGDTVLIDAVTGPRDFHGVNAAAFFGKPYEEIIKTTINEDGSSTHKTIDKPLRQLAKPVNHGANYNMGEAVLIQTMGLKKIYGAAKLLNLPAGMTAFKIAEHLLAAFEATYKVVKGPWYKKVIADVMNTKKLVSPVVGKHRWTRYCFKRPITKEGRINKPALNSYVAHPPQNLNAMTLNLAFKNVFYEVQLNPKFEDNFRMNAQIHDSILFQYREGHDYLREEVKKHMEYPVEVVDTFGTKRTLVVPVDIKGGHKRWG